jgi:hypothetical protein
MRDLHPVEVVILCAVALAWAVATIARTLLLPVLALVLVLLTPRRYEDASSCRPAGAAPPQPAPEPAQPVLPPVTLATIAEELQALPAAHLRSITGCRRKVAKRAMVDAWLAMPV